MVLRLLARHLRIRPSGHRFFSTNGPTPARRGRVGLVAAAIAVGSSPLFLMSTVQADSGDQALTSGPSKASRLRDLLRTYIVYTMCQSETLVDNSPKMLSVLTSIPGVKQVTEALVRITFFNQFVGGDTADETVPLLNELRATNIGTLFAYSVEVDENEATAAQEQAAHRNGGLPTYKRSVGEMIRCIDVAADFEDKILGNTPVGRRTWVAIKMTALLPDAKALVHLSQAIIDSRKKSPIPFPGSPQRTDLDVLYGPTPAKIMPPEEVEALRDLHGDLVQICRRAKERDVKIIIDAEYSWYQPAVDAFQTSLMREFNKLDGKDSVQPLIYGTYQAYLRRTPLNLVQSFAEAEAGGYALGVKLVRGAYHPHEIAAHSGRPKSISISPDELPPVWLKKEDTDNCYNNCAKVLVGKIKEDIAYAKGRGSQRVGVLFGTHNWTSSKLILKELVATGLGKNVGEEPESDVVVQLGDEVTERLTFGQLYGMSDALTDYLVKHTRSNAPMIIKYVPYGALSEVMPYLGRRAIENKSVLGNGAAAEERKRAGSEIKKLLFG